MSAIGLCAASAAFWSGLAVMAESTSEAGRDSRRSASSAREPFSGNEARRSRRFAIFAKVSVKALRVLRH